MLALIPIFALVLLMVSPAFWMLVFGIAGTAISIVDMVIAVPSWVTTLGYIALVVALCF